MVVPSLVVSAGDHAAWCAAYRKRPPRYNLKVKGTRDAFPFSFARLVPLFLTHRGGVFGVFFVGAARLVGASRATHGEK
jgi:hypothetical protein